MAMAVAKFSRRLRLGRTGLHSFVRSLDPDTREIFTRLLCTLTRRVNAACTTAKYVSLFPQNVASRDSGYRSYFVIAPPGIPSYARRIYDTPTGE